MNSKFSLLCRPARLEEHPKLVEFQLAMALETENLRLDRETCSRGVAAVFQDPNLGHYFIAEIEGRVVGSLLIIPEWSDWRNGLVWWIHSVYVIPSERGEGVFTSLFEMIKKQGESLPHFKGLRLYVDKSNTRAQAVYKRLGMSNHHYELFEWMRSP